MPGPPPCEVRWRPRPGRSALAPGLSDREGHLTSHELGVFMEFRAVVAFDVLGATLHPTSDRAELSKAEPAHMVRCAALQQHKIAVPQLGSEVLGRIAQGKERSR